MAVAKQVKDKFNIKNEKDYYLGSIAPDVAKQIGMSKDETHFRINGKYYDLELFKKNYPTYLTTDFLIGYYVHLFTDQIWLDEVESKLIKNNSVKLLDGTIVEMEDEEIHKLIYNDYSTLNEEVIDLYDLHLDILYGDYVIPDIKMKEFPVEKLDILTSVMGNFVFNNDEHVKYLFDIDHISNFIDICIKKIK